MSTTALKSLATAIAAALALAGAGCTKPSGDPPPPVDLGPSAPSALVIEANQPQAALPAIRGLIAVSACPREHLAVIGPSASGKTLAASLSPSSPTMPGPDVPVKPSAGATQFQWDTYHHQLARYQAMLARDRSALARLQAAHLRTWATTVSTTLAKGAGGARVETRQRTDFSAATAYFTSLQQAGEDIGTRKVIVIFATPALDDEALWIRSGSLSGITVIVANFRGSDATEQVELQATLLEAGAARAVVLVPAATGELAAITRIALEGQTGPAPASLRFAAGQSSLLPEARSALAQLATELTRNFPDAQTSILGFGDLRGDPARQDLLSQQRAQAVQAFLEAHGVAAAQLFAAGYGTDLADPRGAANRAQSLAQRVIVVINVAT